MELILVILGIGAVAVGGYWAMRESDEDRRQDAEAKAWIAQMQATRARAASAAYERQRAPRSSPVYTGSQARSSGSTPMKTEVKRHDNSFDLEVDTYTAPTYHSSHKSCSGGGSSGNDSNSSNDSSSASCD